MKTKVLKVLEKFGKISGRRLRKILKFKSAPFFYYNMGLLEDQGVIKHEDRFKKIGGEQIKERWYSLG